MSLSKPILTLSARELSALLSPYFCPLSFWIQKHLKPPSEPFPALPSDVDRLLKKSVEESWKKHRRLPLWLESLGIEGEPIFPRPTWRNFFVLYPHKKGSIRIHGEPDEVILLDNGELHIIDYKLSAPKQANSDTERMYAVQLLVYAYIAAKVTLSPLPAKARNLSLIYLTLKAEGHAGTLGDLDDPEHLWLHFHAQRQPMDEYLHYPSKALEDTTHLSCQRKIESLSDLIECLIERAVDIVLSPTPPASQSDWADFYVRVVGALAPHIEHLKESLSQKKTRSQKQATSEVQRER